MCLLANPTSSRGNPTPYVLDASLQLGSFGWMKDIVFPIWLGLMTLSFVCLEIRKQYRRYFSKGAAKLCGFMEVLNEEALGRNQAPDRLVPRTENLPIYTMPEFNDKVGGVHLFFVHSRTRINVWP